MVVNQQYRKTRAGTGHNAFLVLTKYWNICFQSSLQCVAMQTSVVLRLRHKSVMHKQYHCSLFGLVSCLMNEIIQPVYQSLGFCFCQLYYMTSAVGHFILGSVALSKCKGCSSTGKLSAVLMWIDVFTSKINHMHMYSLLLEVVELIYFISLIYFKIVFSSYYYVITFFSLVIWMLLITYMRYVFIQIFSCTTVKHQN